MKRIASCLILLLIITTTAMADDIEIVPIKKPVLKEYSDVSKLQSKARDLYNKILSIKKQPKFAEVGFGVSFPEGHQ